MIGKRDQFAGLDRLPAGPLSTLRSTAGMPAN